MSDNDQDAKRSDMIRKCQALWTQAEHPNTSPEEAATFRTAAAKLMAKYQIDEMTLSASGTSIADDITFSSVRLTTDGKDLVISDQLMELVHTISLANDCRGILLRRETELNPETGVYAAGGTFYQCIGYRRDVHMVKSLYFLLCADLFVAMMGEKKQDAAYQKSFAFGYQVRIKERLGEVRRAREDMADQTSTGMGLAVRSKKGNVHEFFDQMYPPSQMDKPVKIRNFNVNPDAANRGRTRAGQADLGGDRKVGGGSGTQGAIGNG